MNRDRIVVDSSSNFHTIPIKSSNFDTETSARSLRSLRKISEKEQMELNRQRYLKFQADHMEKQVNVMVEKMDRRSDIIKKKEQDKLRLALLRTREDAIVQ